MEIVLSAVVANFSGLTNEQLLQYIRSEVDGFEYYEPIYVPGRVYASSKNWKAIGNIGKVLAIADILWRVHSEMIVPNKAPTTNSGIIIQLEGNHNSIWLGHNVNSKDELVERLKVNISQGQIDTVRVLAEIDSLRKSPRWKRID